jgi:hypothetical protein
MVVDNMAAIPSETASPPLLAPHPTEVESHGRQEASKSERMIGTKRRRGDSEEYKLFNE